MVKIMPQPKPITIYFDIDKNYWTNYTHGTIISLSNEREVSEMITDVNAYIDNLMSLRTKHIHNVKP